MNDTLIEFSLEANEMHAGAADWEERREVMRELNEEFSESGTQIAGKEK